MSEATKVQNILIVITAAIIVIFVVQEVVNMLNNEGHSLMQTRDDTAASQRQQERNTSNESSPIKNATLPASSSSSLTNIFKQVEHSVVQITSKVPNTKDILIIINGNPLKSQSTRLGSGFVYDNHGHIVTNNHVVDSAKTVDVTFVDGNTYSAKVVGTDPSSDIAVLQILDNFPAENVVPLVFANSSRLQVGEQVIAIGNPFGLKGTMTTGIVSQIGHLLPNPNTGFSIPHGIQTDAAINPGNSGGPLLDMQARVVGMNTAISSSTGLFSGVGFAIPSNALTRIVPALIQNGSFSHPWLGISGESISPDLANSIGLARNYKGVVVTSVHTGSPAAKAGLIEVKHDKGIPTSSHVGDIIIGIDGHPLKGIDDIINYIEDHKSVGDNVKLAVNRSGHIINLNLILQERPLSLRL